MACLPQTLHGKLVHLHHLTIKRPWKERLFSRPWKPWVSRKPDNHIYQMPGAISMLQGLWRRRRRVVAEHACDRFEEDRLSVRACAVQDEQTPFADIARE